MKTKMKTKMKSEMKVKTKSTITIALLFCLLNLDYLEAQTDTIFVTYGINLCAGEAFQGENWFADTIIHRHHISYSGIDSITTFHIDILSPENFRIEGETAFCKGEISILDAGNYAQYIWSNGSADSNIDVSATGKYGVTVTNSAGCTATHSVEVLVSDIFLEIGLIEPNCNGYADGTLIAAASGGIEPYLFSLNGDAFQPESDYGEIEAGDYEIVTQDAIGCEQTEEVEVTEPEIFEVDLGENATILKGDSLNISLHSNQPIQYIQWQPQIGLSCSNCPSPILNPSKTTTYEVFVTNIHGCIADDEILIEVDKIRKVFIPNAFSPNGDGENDQLTIFTGAGVKSINRMEIFDRWGNQIFETRNHLPNDVGRGWDGTFKGKQMQSDVYVLFAEITFTDGESEVFEQDIMLLR